MTGVLATSAAAIALTLLVGWAVPAWAMKRLVPVLESSGHLVTNYRGSGIPTGLGMVFLVWAAGVALAYAAVNEAWSIAMQAPSDFATLLIDSPALSVVTMVPLTLVVGAFAFGFVDDMYGAGSAKGFRGHLRAIADGRITTGGLKLFGIGLLSVMAATRIPAYVSSFERFVGAPSMPQAAAAVGALVCSVLVIALSANLVNLTDLRPGRAIKTYGVLVVGALILLVVSVLPDLPVSEIASASGILAVGVAKIPALCLGILLLGPVAAIWRYDLGERAMLGDAGANAMGALAGFFLAYGSPLWLLAVLAVVLLVLNLASERISFSSVIEHMALLRWIDGLGRVPAQPAGVVYGNDGNGGERTGGSAAAEGEAKKGGGSSNR